MPAATRTGTSHRSRTMPTLGSYEPHASLRDALDHLGLWELPWMRHELETFTGGVAYDDRFSIWDRLTEGGVHRAS